MIDLQVIEQESRLAVMEICEASRIKKSEIFVVGCSSSEVLGDRIGTATNVDVAEAIYNGIASVLAERRLSGRTVLRTPEPGACDRGRSA